MKLGIFLLKKNFYANCRRNSPTTSGNVKREFTVGAILPRHAKKWNALILSKIIFFHV